MKNFTTLIALLCFAIPAMAQKDTPNALPSRSDTINYLDKRAREVVSLHATGAGSNHGYIYKHMVYADGDGKISIMRESGSLASIKVTGDCNTSSVRMIETFRPSQIVDVKLATDNSSVDVGFANIVLKSASARETMIWFGYKEAIQQGLSGYGLCTFYGETSRGTNTQQVVHIAFLKSDPENFSKVRKALFHLRDLDKATDDPFGD